MCAARRPRERRIPGRAAADHGNRYREEIREGIQLNKEVSEAISSVQITDPDDEEELEAMFSNLEQTALDAVMISAPPAPVSTQPQAVQPGKDPKRPRHVGFCTDAPPVAAAKPQEEDEEAELRKLQAEMAM